MTGVHGRDDDPIQLSLPDVELLAHAALTANGTSEANARLVAQSIAAAEADAIPSHGLMRLPTYCAHASSGKVDGNALPETTMVRPGAWTVDAKHGFAHPAIASGFEALVPATRQQGIAALAVQRSYNCGVVGHHVEQLAKLGLVAIAYVNTPAAIAPWGGSKALFGTNPLAFAVPRLEAPPLVIDQSSSVIARGEVMLHATRGTPIPAGWALDASGSSTTDPAAALQGSMLPAGGYKGAGLALMVELLAAALTGANFSFAASSFADQSGGPPGTGQLFVAIDPSCFGGVDFTLRVEALLSAMLAQPGVRLPGDRRLSARARSEREGVRVSRALVEKIASLGAERRARPV